MKKIYLKQKIVAPLFLQMGFLLTARRDAVTQIARSVCCKYFMHFIVWYGIYMYIYFYDLNYDIHVWF